MSVSKIPDQILEKLRCECGRYLSKPPICIKDGQNVCSDCAKESANGPPFPRSIPYEALASLYSFPCRGCTEYVEFEEMENHELVCLRQNQDCPARMYLACNWCGSDLQVFQHFKEQHADFPIVVHSPHVALVKLPAEPTEVCVIFKNINS